MSTIMEKTTCICIWFQFYYLNFSTLICISQYASLICSIIDDLIKATRNGFTFILNKCQGLLFNHQIRLNPRCWIYILNYGHTQHTLKLKGTKYRTHFLTEPIISYLCNQRLKAYIFLSVWPNLIFSQFSIKWNPLKISQTQFADKWRTRIHVYRPEPARAQRRHIIENTKSQKFRLNIILFRTFLFHHRALAVRSSLRANNQIIKNKKKIKEVRSSAPNSQKIKETKRNEERLWECKENEEA